MTVAGNEVLEDAFGLVKQHENALAKVQHSNHRVERDIFGELLADTRNMSCELQRALEARNISVDEIVIPENSGVITPHSLIGQRNRMRSAFAEAISEYSSESSVRTRLETQYSALAGGGQEKLDILCSAILSDQ